MSRCVPILVALLLGNPILGPLAHAQSGGEATLGALIGEYEQLLRKDDPVSAGQEGERDALRRLPDGRPEVQQAHGKQLESISKRLARIDATRLSEDAALNHMLLTDVVATHAEQISYDLTRIAFENDSGFHTLLDYLARTTTISSREDADAWLARLEAAPAFYEQNLANLQRGIKTKFTQPRIVADRVLEVARKHAATKAEDSSLLLPFTRLPASIPAAVQEEYRVKALTVVRDRIQPLQRKFAEFMAKEYLPAARPKLAWRTTPNGESTYKFFVRRETTTQMTPDEIHRLGLSEVKRIRGLMEQTIAETGFKGSFADFLQMLRTDPRFYAKTPEELLAKASEIAKRSDDQLPRLFGTLPRLPYGVRPVPLDIADGRALLGGQHAAGAGGRIHGQYFALGSAPAVRAASAHRARSSARPSLADCAVAGTERSAVLPS
jgi:uncharacterized protein (DUF885 family)